MEESNSIPPQDWESRPWPCWIEVDLDAIRHNARALKQLVSPSCQLMAVVKAEAYGHGAVAVARAALEAGASWLGVARVREGAALRRAGIEAPILVLGPLSEGEGGLIVRYGLHPAVSTLPVAIELSRAAVSQGRPAAVHLKVNSGLGRYGLALDEARPLLGAIRQLPGIRLEGLFSHFATADEPDSQFALEQLDRFQAIRAELESDGFEFELVHMAASAATIGLAGSHLNMVRIGISMYGSYPAPHLAAAVTLRPALSFHSRVTRVFDLQPGDSVGYGRTFKAERPTRAALVPIGYGDGLPRSHSNRGCMLVNGRRAQLIGRVSMDQCVVDVTRLGSVECGSPVVAIGTQGGEEVGIDEFAERSGTISYEVLTMLNGRVPRVYLRGGSVVGVAYLSEGRLLTARDGRLQEE